MPYFTEYGTALNVAIILLGPQNYQEVLSSSNLINSPTNLTGFRRKGGNSISHPASLLQSRFPTVHLEMEVLPRFWSSHDIDFVWWRNSERGASGW
jgi:hypothetical protein